MFLELIATFAAGLGAAGVVLLLNRITGGRLPGWAMPVAAGATMIGVAIWSEMTWADRTADALPDGIEVAETVTESAWWRPWTYLWPQTTRFIAVDMASIRTNPAARETRLLDLYLFARWQPVARVPQLVHCSMPGLADVTDASLAEPDAADWRPVAENDALLRLACKEMSNG